jgi:hypothetical protein
MSYGSETYDVTRTAIVDVLEARDQARTRGDRDGDHWPAWGQLLLAVITVIVTVVMAYGALNTRITVVESKLDDLKQQIGALHR